AQVLVGRDAEGECVERPGHERDRVRVLAAEGIGLVVAADDLQHAVAVLHAARHRHARAGARSARDVARVEDVAAMPAHRPGAVQPRGELVERVLADEDGAGIERFLHARRRHLGQPVETLAAAESIERAYFRASDTRTHCPWKGEASYYDVVVDGEINEDAVWYYPEPKEAAAAIGGRVAFWRVSGWRERACQGRDAKGRR